MNHKGSGLLGRVAQWVLIALGVIFTLMIFSGSDTGIDGGLWVTYFAFGIAAVSTLAFSLMGLNKKSFMGMGAFVVVLVVAYLISDGGVRPEWNISEGASKWIGAGLILMYVALFGAIIAIVYGEVTRLFK
ncbi:MAG: hypothetical protein QY325_11470 [Flavobacteriales bacterium]|jgi:hypothetical protein|nr:MAG: hypothetical protein QY325_11470 [Flavobacteriales bacterium]